jgi:hypothetical protein
MKGRNVNEPLRSSGAATKRRSGTMKPGTMRFKGNHSKRNQGMNGLEKKYMETLEEKMITGEIVWYRFERITLKLANNTHYRPDFMVMSADGTLEIHEVKGFWEEDARAKIKIAADQFPFVFKGIKKRPKKDGGGWNVELF